MTKVFIAKADSGKAAARIAFAAAFADRGIPADAEIVKTVLGKPYLKEFPGVQFNLSHSGPYGVCAISSAPVGVDVELVRPLRQDVAKRFFTETEQGWLTQRPPKEFFYLWTRKESFSKALGKGLTLPMHSFSVLDEVIYREGIAWYFSSCPMEDGYLTVCAQEPETVWIRMEQEHPAT